MRDVLRGDVSLTTSGIDDLEALGAFEHVARDTAPPHVDCTVWLASRSRTGVMATLMRPR
jgi:hypothetical protein